MLSSRSWVVAAAALVTVLIISACGYVPKGPGRPARSAPATGALLGTYTEPARPDRAGQQTATLRLEAEMGRKVGIAHWFYPWTSPFPTWREPWARSGGRLNMVSWAPAP